MIINQFKRRSLSWIHLPTHLHDEFEAFGTSRRNWWSEFTATNQIHYGTLFHILIWYFTCQQFPKDHTKRPDVHLFRTSGLLNRLWRHPGDCTREAHFFTDFVPCSRGAKVAYLYYFFLPYQNTAKKLCNHKLIITKQMFYFGLFKSRWMILCECKYCMPLAICFDHVITRLGVTAFF